MLPPLVRTTTLQMRQITWSAFIGFPESSPSSLKCFYICEVVFGLQMILDFVKELDEEVELEEAIAISGLIYRPRDSTVCTCGKYIVIIVIIMISR